MDTNVTDFPIAATSNATRCVVFDNPGEIDLAAISTFGVSVKEGDNPIGFFGTGLKYALAILLRTGHGVTIWSGLQRIEFTTEQVAIRGQDFAIVCMNGERMGFTTQVGKGWDLWMAYRELFCNARDEGGEAYGARAEPDPTEGRTLIAVTGQDFAAVHHDRWQYFIEDEPEIECAGTQIWRRPSASYFYRGVAVQRLPRQSMFTYNDTVKLELTEDRTVKHGYQVAMRVARCVMQSTDEKMLRDILTAPAEWFEHHLDFHGWGDYAKPSAAFLKVTGNLVNANASKVNATAKKVWEDANPVIFEPKPTALTPVQQKTLDRAIDFCERLGFTVRNYPIVVTESLGGDILGMAENGTIYIADRAFHMGGTKQVASVLIEEYVHLRHLYHDCTREMQNWLFERMVSMGEELVGEPL